MEMPMTDKKKSIKVLLISPYSYKFCAMGIRQLYKMIKNIGIEVRLVFFMPYTTLNNRLPAEKEYDLLKNEILSFKPDLIGLSVYSATYQIAQKITILAKQIIPDNLTVWGGIHPTIASEECIHYADVVNVGEGYSSFIELIRCLDEGRSFTHIPNLWIRNGEKIIRNPLGPLVTDLDSIPFSDYSDENKIYIKDGRINEKNPFLHHSIYHIMTSLGCPFSCTYCCNSQLRALYKNCGPYIRRRSVENVIAELEQAWALNQYEYVSFCDDVFTMNPEWLQRFSKLYKEKIHKPFFCYSHAQSISEKIVKDLHYAGMEKTTIGIQSGSEEFKKKIYNRLETNEQLIEAGRLYQKYGIRVVYDFITNNPLETEGNMRETFNLILKLSKPFKIEMAQLLHFPTYPLTDMLLQKNLISNDELDHSAQKSLKTHGVIINLDMDAKNRYWALLYMLAAYLKLPKFSVNFLLSGFFRMLVRVLIYPVWVFAVAWEFFKRRRKVDI